MEFIIEYWSGTLPLTNVEGNVSEWLAAPKENVVWVYCRYEGRPGKVYTLRLLGSDFYYLFHRGSDIVFGSWTDPRQPWAVEGRVGTEYTLHSDNIITSEPLATPPMNTSDRRVKAGVMLPDDIAEELGLIGDGPSQLIKYRDRPLRG